MLISYIIRRLVILIPVLFIISVLSFVLVQLPPGSYIDTYLANLRNSGLTVDKSEIARLIHRYDLDQPLYVQYYTWIKKFLHGDLGRSYEQDRPTAEILAERIPRSILLTMLATVFMFVVAIPIGIYSATHQYSIFDYSFTFIGFIGLAIPNFLFAIVLMWGIYSATGSALVGLFSVKFMGTPWSLIKIADLLKHLWIPVVVIGTAGTAGLIRIMRGTLLDELRKQYVITARAKGVKERKLLFKYPFRVAINPIISTIGWMLPLMVSGETIVSIVLNIPTVGPVLLRAVMAQDMYFAGSTLMILSSLTVIGTLISDILLVWLDPRIRYGKQD